MSRYIDAEWLMNFFVDIPNNFTLTIGNLRATVNDAPSIDIVCCRECRHRNERCGMGEHRWCEMLNMSTTPDDFCSYGEREGE